MVWVIAESNSMKLDTTPLHHAAIAVVIQTITALLTGNWWAGAALSAGIFIGREHAQAEYRWIETFGSHRRAYLPWWGGFDRRVWDAHSWWWNLLLPIICVLSVCCFLQFT